MLRRKECQDETGFDRMHRDPRVIVQSSGGSSGSKASGYIHASKSRRGSAFKGLNGDC